MQSQIPVRQKVQVFNIVEEIYENPTQERSLTAFSEDAPVVSKRSKPHSMKRKTPNIKSTSSIRLGHWTPSEERKFNEGVKKYGHNWEKVATHIKTRTVIQCRSHNQKLVAKKRKAKLESKTDELYYYLKRTNAAALDAAKEVKQEDILIDPHLKKTLWDILEPFAVDGTIVLNKEMLVYAIQKMAKKSEGEERIPEVLHVMPEERHIPPIIPLRVPEMSIADNFFTENNN